MAKATHEEKAKFNAIFNRIREVVPEIITVNDLANELELNYNSLKTRKPQTLKESNLIEFTKKKNLNFDWLYDGTGEKYKNHQERENNTHDIFSSLNGVYKSIVKVNESAESATDPKSPDGHLINEDELIDINGKILLVIDEINKFAEKVGSERRATFK